MARVYDHSELVISSSFLPACFWSSRVSATVGVLEQVSGGGFDDLRLQPALRVRLVEGPVHVEPQVAVVEPRPEPVRIEPIDQLRVHAGF